MHHPSGRRVSFICGMILLFATAAAGQEATIGGVVTDSSGGVLPGVTITARHTATGNVYESVTDAGGRFRTLARVGTYDLTFVLPGFSTVTRAGLNLQVGQTLDVTVQLVPATVQESVTVTAEAPLIDVSSSKVGGNVDARQMQELPLNGRDWTQLTALAPGARGNATGSNQPATADDSVNAQGLVTATYQLSIDGQRVNNTISTGTYSGKSTSRDALGEFEYVTGRFDATQGHSMGVQVNAVTKAGTNQFRGTASGYFRDDKFIAKDFVAGRVLPFSNQQLSTTFGGPVKRDRLHFFGYFERERSPRTILFNSPFPKFNIDMPTSVSTDTQGGARVDLQMTPSRHLMLRGHRWRGEIPAQGGGATVHPSMMTESIASNNQLFGRLVQTLGTRATNELRGGFWASHRTADGLATCDRKPQPTLLATPDDCRPPFIQLAGYSLGTQNNNPQDVNEENYQVANTFSMVAGRHELKAGGEYMYQNIYLIFGNGMYGVIDATAGPVPANVQDLFPVWNDWSTWNLAALSPITRRYQVSLGVKRMYDQRHVFAGFLQDDWKIRPSLTLNLGLRYDVSRGSNGENVPPLPPFRLAEDIKGDYNNVAPRVGFVYALPDDRTAIRGGYGLYYAELLSVAVHWSAMAVNVLAPAIQNDGRPNFTADPFNGNVPTYDTVRSIVSRFDVSGTGVIDPTDIQTPYSHQTSIGFERQLGQTMSYQVDYVWKGNRELLYRRNANQAYDPVTGVNYPFSDISKRPYPDWGVAPMFHTGGRSNVHSIDTAFTRRLSDRWQLSGSYSLSWLKDDTQPKPVPNAPDDLGGEYSYGIGDQRHRAVVNGIWDAPLGIQVSGLYVYGSGERFQTSTGVNRRDFTFGPSIAVGGLPNRLRADGTLVPRNGFVGEPIHRVDMRVQRGIPIGGRARVDGIIEVYNLFNHANYGSYVTVEGATYGRPTQNLNLAYTPRMLQFGVRASF